MVGAEAGHVGSPNVSVVNPHPHMHVPILMLQARIDGRHCAYTLICACTCTCTSLHLHLLCCTYVHASQQLHGREREESGLSRNESSKQLSGIFNWSLHGLPHAILSVIMSTCPQRIKIPTFQLRRTPSLGSLESVLRVFSSWQLATSCVDASWTGHLANNLALVPSGVPRRENPPSACASGQMANRTRSLQILLQEKIQDHG